MSGKPFLPNVFGSATIYFEVAFGADLTASSGTWSWTDVTADVMHNAQVNITQGRSDETSQAQPASCAFTLLNTLGTYTPYNATSSLYPNVRRNTPIRVRLDLGSGATTLFFGFAVGFTPDWSASASAKLAVVQVSAAGILRRLTQGKSPVLSPMFRTISGTSPTAWWPLESGTSTSQAASGLLGGLPLLVTSGSVAFTSSDAPAGAAGSAAFATGGTMSAKLPTIGSSSYRIEFAMKGSTISSGDFIAIIDWHMTAGGIEVWEIGANAAGEGGLYAQWSDATGTNADFYSSNVTVDDGAWHHIRVDISTSGGNQVVKVAIDNVQVINQNTAQTFAAPVNLVINPTGDPNEELPAISHLALWAPWSGSQDTYYAFTGYTGETVEDRITRNCGEQGITLSLTGGALQTMGPQPLASFVDILRDCEATDGGVLYDGFASGIGYICRSSRYSLSAAITVNAATGQLSPPFAPVHDDQRNRNDITVSRPNGSSARAVDADGPLGTDAIGVYDSSITVNTDTDNALSGIASWQVHLGTVDDLRYPNQTFDFVSVSALAQSWLNTLGTTPRVDVQNVDNAASQAPPDDVSVIVEGHTQTLSVTSWTAVANCSPYAPWRVAVVDDASTGRVSADDATLAGTLTSTFTGSRTVNVGHLWTTTAGDFPLDINIAGEQITLSNITGAASPQTFVISARSVNGVVKAHSSGEAVDVWTPAVVAL